MACGVCVVCAYDFSSLLHFQTFTETQVVRFSFYLFTQRGSREKERERNISVQLPLTHPLLGPWLATQPCALPGNPTGHPLAGRPVLNPLSHTSRGGCALFNQSCMAAPMGSQVLQREAGKWNCGAQVWLLAGPHNSPWTSYIKPLVVQASPPLGVLGSHTVSVYSQRALL